MNKKDVFLSHSSDDKNEFIHPLIESLRDYSISYWLDEMEIGWGDSIIRKINEGLSISKFVLVLLTESFLRKNWTKTEIECALTEEISGDRIIVLPIMATDPRNVFKAFPLLRNKLYIMWDEDTSKVSEKLLELLNRQYSAEWIGHHPADFVGKVHIQVLKQKKFLSKQHRFSVRWGPWLYENTLPVCKNNSISLVHTKGNDGLSVPIFFQIDPPCYVKFEIKNPETETIVDINYGWKKVE